LKPCCSSKVCRKPSKRAAPVLSLRIANMNDA
jgi:hypothetical protein